MKTEYNSNNIEDINWKYFANIHQLSQYLSQSDLIQLSSTCSQFRNKLNSTIFRKLELIKHDEIIPGKPNISSTRKQLEILIDILEDDYLNKYHFVKHFVLWKPCNSSFTRKLFNIFTHITNIELYLTGANINSYTLNPNSISYLTHVLKPLTKLEILVIDCKLIKSLEARSIENFKLPTCLKVLNVVGFSNESLSFSPVENINDEYTELKKVAIINNNMLFNIPSLIKSLTEVVILHSQYLCPKLLAQFFSLNSQLKKVSICLKFIEPNVVNSILQLKKLDQLNITKYGVLNTVKLQNLKVNTFIKHLNISCDITQSILLPILSSTKSISTLEFSNCNFQIFNYINWSSYTGTIPLLHLNSLWNTDFNLKELLNSTIFDRIKFTNNLNLGYYIKFHGFSKLENWKIVQDDPSNEWEFCLFRKLESEVNK